MPGYSEVVQAQSFWKHLHLGDSCGVSYKSFQGSQAVSVAVLELTDKQDSLK